MIDTLKIKVSPEYLSDKHYDILYETLFKPQYIRDEDGSISIKGKLENLRVQINNRGLVIEGSLPKYLCGSNQQSLNLSEITDGIEELNKLLEVDLYQSKVLRVDLAENIITKYPVEDYYPILSQSPYFKRLEMDNGLAYKNNSRYVVFYGKMKEIKKGEQIRDAFVGKNVLRYEYRMQKNKVISDFLRVPNATLMDLLNNYYKVVGSWADVFMKINKLHDIRPFDFSIFQKNGEFERYIKLLGVESIGGFTSVNATIKEAKRRGYLNKHPNVASNLINKFKGMSTSPLLATKSSLADELEEKVKMIRIFAVPGFELPAHLI